MAEDPEELFLDWELESSISSELKREKQLSAPQRRYYNLCRRKSFAAFVASKRDSSRQEGTFWCCCSQTFMDHSAIHKHVARMHHSEIQQLMTATYERLLKRIEEDSEGQQLMELKVQSVDISAWIPETGHIPEQQLHLGPGKVLLYYHYCHVEDPNVICSWQKALCEKLHLTGKVRVATEGINGTVGGTDVATQLYIEAMCSHPVFRLDKEDFKTSDGGAKCFPDLRVGVYKEIVPMGVDPAVLSYQLAGAHLEPEEFHKEVEALVAKGSVTPSESDTVLLDCRNFYESKIGQFTQCLAPNIRKFSYFPDYVDQNLDLFRDKKVLMYCTGGIRCERASAYLISKEVCKDVYQLKGGIHKYLERFPDGFYRGKLFVFDERFSISSNDDVISGCRYCHCPWDQYEVCSTRFCCQLVLSCPSCRQEGHTGCCPTCQSKGRGSEHTLSRREECECTSGRPRIPQDV
ncbi:thiosulfate sulfurtransferase/rhodanese-like domain-containing protein 2 isoform X1 [Takifugu rubripes]|uniref:Thiosulfate sulfurtransferase/rhodanese-like domain-containing protein 2 n=2 Tax=Takifugu rubripes TaxID=31033 RepID=H2SPD7_TAKRU|nr:thiosulfate sulfurtransferase/rhodanese-like domain-containing protein 2 isoform X1 [Takifugu rubripes]